MHVIRSPLPAWGWKFSSAMKADRSFRTSGTFAVVSPPSYAIAPAISMRASVAVIGSPVLSSSQPNWPAGLFSRNT